MFFSEEAGLAIVADGIGGLGGGDTASRMAVELISQRILEFSATTIYRDGKPDPLVTLGHFANSFVDWLQEVNEDICRKGIKNPRFKTIGTTIAVFFAMEMHAFLAHLGDTRIYRIRDESIHQMTRDHSFVEELTSSLDLRDKVEMLGKQRKFVTRALGLKEVVYPDMQIRELRVGDTYIICTDGLTGMLTDEEIKWIVLNVGDDVERACENLVNRANFRGGRDNITVVIGRVHE